MFDFSIINDFFIFSTVWIPLGVALVCCFFMILQIGTTFWVFGHNLSSQITNLIFNFFSYLLILYGIAWGVSKAGSAGCFLVGGSVSSASMVDVQNDVSLATVTAVSALVINFAAGLNFLNYLSNGRFLYFSDWRVTYENAKVLGFLEMLLRSMIAALFFILTFIIGSRDFDLGNLVFAFGSVEFSYLQNADAYFSGSEEVVQTCEELMSKDPLFVQLGFTEAATQILDPIGWVAVLSLVLYGCLSLWVIFNALAMLKACKNGHIVDCSKQVRFHAGLHIAMAIIGMLVSWLIADIYNYGDVLYSDFFFTTLTPGALFDGGGQLFLAQLLAYVLVILIMAKPIIEILLRRKHPVGETLKPLDIPRKDS